MIKDYLIAVDLDGTLVTGFDRYDRKSIRYLRKLAKANLIVIATGRPLPTDGYEMLELVADHQLTALVHNPRLPLPKTMIT